MALDLALVMPVYNEEACIVEVIQSWYDTLTRLGINFRMIVLNDGSTDGTGEALNEFAAEDRIEVVHKQNSGHGPTILTGYREAVRLADWVFQCDSDDEMKSEYFSSLWHRREAYDALFGVRQGRGQSVGRRVISACSRTTVKWLFGDAIHDVNTPYRLIRASILDRIIRQIPGDTFAPNVIISGALAKARLRIYHHPVPHQGRRTGNVSIVKWKLWRAAFKSFMQTLKCRPSIEPLEK